MLMNRNEVEVTLGRSAEWEASIDEWATVQGQNAGFAGGTHLQSYANPGRYTLISRWIDREASIAAGRREQFTALTARLLTSGLARPTRLTESYDSVFEVDREGAAATGSTAERFIDFTLNNPRVAPEFEDHMRQLAQASTQHASGVISVRLRRSAGFDTRYLLIVIAADRAAARGWLLAPELRALRESAPIQEYLSGTPSAEIYHVVKRYAGPALSAIESAAVEAAITGR